MIRSASTKKKIAIFFLGLMTLETLVPLKGLALTSGPVQPEMTQFQPAGMSDMVDLFTGDFKYNIPLMDVDGYPVNLTYSQGVGMEDEASWVGLGWNLNVGSITRQLKGIPDDHMAERVNSIQHMKRKVTTGGQFRARMEVTGFNVAKLGGSVSMGVFYDNYTGYGAEVGVGANAGLMLTGRNASGLTLGLNGDMTSNTSSGVSSKLGASLGISMTDDNQMTSSINGNLSLGYNTREGLKSLTMGGSFNPGGLKVMEGYWTRDLNTPVFYPAPEIAFRSSSRTYSLDLGVAATVVNVGFGGTGYKTIREVKSEFNTHFAYGTMYSAEGKDNDNALMDFMREKDNIVIKDMNHIALPISMPDVFNYTSQAGSGQFALYKGGSGMYFNNKKIDETENFTLGGDFGWGWNFHGGISLFEQNIQDITGKWTSGNNIQKSIDFPGDGSDIREEKTYFKTIGEQTIEDVNFVSAIRDEMPVSISIKGPDAQNSLQAPNVATANAPSAGYKKNGRQLRNTTIQYLTAAEANTAAVERKIYNYPANKYVNGQFTPQACHQVAGVVPIDRVSYRRKKHHLSEMTVVGGDGKRMVYGLPVYNHSQKEISFATDTMKSRTGRATNLVKYRLDGSRIFHKPAGSNEYYSEQEQPGYASSFMLTAILSPDYVDVTGNGLTEDDRGTYVKFNYTRHSEGYRWRSPTGVQEATVNHGMLADPDDDKASFVYGEKELWYLHSIETKTKVAYFITETDRLDGAGVKGLHGGLYTAATVPADQRQLRLREIRLYSKTDHVTPIKSVILKQSFSLCKGSTLDPNIGKMALDSLYFTYGKSTRGMHHPYVFSYKKTAGASNEYGGYGVLQTDRWGTFKPKNASPGGLLNDEYPYSVGTVPDLWLLNKIELPTGGTIDVKYEADTYSYVQNRQAMKMVSMNDVKMLNASGAHTDVFTDMRKLKLAKVPGVTNLQEFRDKYLSGSKYLYGKMYVNLTDKPRDQNGNNYDWVPCYAEVTGVTPESDSIIVDLEATGVGNRSVNAFLAAAYQRMRLDYPRYAWPGYKNKIADDMPLDAAMNALSNALGNFREIREDFNERALRKGFASGFNKAKSFIRLSAFDKEGGGARVKSLETREIWDGGPEEVSIQRYSYTTEGPNGAVISSGVAAYEPSIGGDENPFRQPDPYTQVNRKALDNEYYLEEPFGEALFPAPTVGYRKVRVENRSAIDESRNTPVSQTGYLQYEFYTAKEFPTEVEWTNLQKYEKRPPAFSSFFGGKAIHELALSQGYLVRMNDMHGKPRAERVFNQLKEEISATEYFYNAEERGGAMRLVNKVDVVGSDGAITKDQILGREMDMIADMREGETSNFGTTIQVGMDVFQLGLFTIPIPHWPKASNIDYRLFRSASVVKTASYYGVVQKIVKKVDGSSVTTYNLLFDKLTGQPVVTAVENEFNDPVYSLNIPAYWINSRMGHAYQTANMIYRQLKVDANGDVSALYRQYLLPGDELVDIERPGQRFWAIQTAKTPGGPLEMRLIDRMGTLAKDVLGDFKVVRSGNRNQMGASASSIVSLEKPYDNLRLKMDVTANLASLQTIEAKAVLFSEDWGQPLPCKLLSCPEGYIASPDGLRCLQPAATPPGTDPLNLQVYTNQFTMADFCTQTWIYAASNSNTPLHTISSTNFWSGGSQGGRLGRNTIWPRNTSLNTWYRIVYHIPVTEAKTYYIGYAADDSVKVRLNDTLVGVSDFTSWKVKPIHLKNGYNRFEFDFLDSMGAGATYNRQGLGWEIYDNSWNEVLAAKDNNAQDLTVFRSSRTMVDPARGEKYQVYKLGPDRKTPVQALYTCSGGTGMASIDEPFPYCDAVPMGECPTGYVKTADGLGCVPAGGAMVYRPKMSLVRGDKDLSYSAAGALIKDSNNNVIGNFKDCEFGGSGNVAEGHIGCGKLNFMTKLDTTISGATKMGIRACVEISDSAAYCIGYGGANGVEIWIDGRQVVNLPAGGTGYNDPAGYWHIKRVTLKPGKHVFDVRGGLGTKNSLGFEIYRNTETQLYQTSGQARNYIFQAGNLPYGSTFYDTYLMNGTGTVLARRYSCSGAAIDICEGSCGMIRMSRVINPYVTGHLGNWLPEKEYAYLTDRRKTPANTTDVVRKGGYYTAFTPFWQYNATSGKWQQSADINWVNARWITLYDNYSQELENKNALGQYSGTRFGYKGALPLIVGANAKSRELHYDGFEDYKFTLLCTPFVNCPGDEFDIRKIVGTDTTGWISSTESHTGMYSLKLKGNVTLNMQPFDEEHRTLPYILTNGNGEFERSMHKWMGISGFSPMRSRKYILSMWVKDGNPTLDNILVSVSINGQNVTDKKRLATVEGWKLLEYQFDMSNYPPDIAGNVPLLISGPATCFVDDIRIFPYDGQAVTYAYDDRTLRLMAELDANNFATFYEYDEQGGLIRIKKETEKGIITIKESRSTYLKKL